MVKLICPVQTMETGSAARTNGTTGKPEDVKSPSAPKKEEEVKKNTNSSGGEKEALKGTGSASLETGQIKSSLFSGSDWKRPIIQFVESSDEKRSTYFSMDSADSKKMQYASGQIGEMRRPPLSFAEKGDLRKSLFNLDSKKSFLPSEGEGRKSLFSGGQMGDLKKTSLPLVETGDLRRPTFNKPDRAAGSRPRVKLEDVLCDSCIDNKQKAVKSCLVCQASFCELHLKPHLEGAAFRDHQLLDPIRDFEARKCPVHGKTMELFCQTDQMCICYLCMFQEHKNHSTVTVEIEKAGKEVMLFLLHVPISLSNAPQYYTTAFAFQSLLKSCLQCNSGMQGWWMGSVYWRMDIAWVLLPWDHCSNGWLQQYSTGLAEWRTWLPPLVAGLTFSRS